MVSDDLQARILIIDHSTDILQLMRELLDGEGYHVSVRRSLEYGTEDVRELAPDLIIVDSPWNPRAHRWVFVDCLRQDCALDQIPIVLCTGAIREVSESWKRLGAMGIRVIRKPFDIDPLLKEIESMLASRSLVTRDSARD